MIHILNNCPSWCTCITMAMGHNDHIPKIWLKRKEQVSSCILFFSICFSLSISLWIIFTHLVASYICFFSTSCFSRSLQYCGPWQRLHSQFRLDEDDTVHIEFETFPHAHVGYIFFSKWQICSFALSRSISLTATSSSIYVICTRGGCRQNL